MSYMIYVHASFLERLTRFRSKLIVSFLMIPPCLPPSHPPSQDHPSRLSVKHLNHHMLECIFS